MYDRLLQLLTERPRRQGQVSRIGDDGTLWVTVGNRVVQGRRQAGDATAYRTGDSVRLAGEVITGRVVRRKVNRYVR